MHKTEDIMNKKIISTILVTAMTVLSLAGCGSAGTANNADNGSTYYADITDDPSVNTPATAPAQETLIVGTNAAFPPFEYIGDDGNPDGFDVALIKAIGGKMGIR